MRKRSKIFITAILTVLAAVSLFAFSGCGKITVHECVFEEIVDDRFLKEPATCTSQAVYYKSCTCGIVSTETFKSGDTLPHTYEWYPVIEDVAVCTGHKYVNLCSVCKAQAEQVENIGYKNELAHSDKWELITEPDLDNKGLLKGICRDCDKNAEYELPALNKSFYTYRYVEPSCNEVGAHIYTVELDGQKFEFKVEIPTRHILDGREVIDDGAIKSYNDYPNVRPLYGKTITCDESGVLCVYECDVCHETNYITVRKDHARPADEKKITIKYDSCEDEQRYYYDCPNCNDDVNEVKETRPAIGHNFEYTLEVDDAEAKTWKLVGVCKNEINSVVCGAHDDHEGLTDKEVVVKQEATCKTGAIRSYVYKNREYLYTETETLDHRYYDSASKVDVRIKLADSGIVYNADALPNILLYDKEPENPRCSDLGNKAWFKCADCGDAWFVLIKYPHTKPKATAGGATTDDQVVRHADATCTTPETTDFVCTVCHHEVHVEGKPALGHISKVNVVTEPTLTTAGEAIVTCDRCGLNETLVLPALNKNDYLFEPIEQQSCVKRGVDKYTYIYTGDLANASGLPVLEYTVTTETTSDHVNGDAPETIVVRIKDIDYRGYICLNCRRFVITETLG